MKLLLIYKKQEAMKTMKSIYSFGMGLLTMFVFLACSSDSDSEPIPAPEPPPVVEEPDELEFRVLAYVDEASVKGHLGGSDRVVKAQMDKLFRNATNFWNKGSNKLKYKYRYTLADMIVYKGSSQDATFRKKVYNDPMDFSKYDVVILFDCLQDNGETGNGGAACGGGSDHRSVVTVIAGPSKPLKVFEDNTYMTLAHELGHYRGVTDMYQYVIAAKDNPVSHEAFDAPACIMRWTSDGVWSDYAVNCMNLSAGAKQIGKVIPDFFNKLYPKKIEFNVTVSGQPKGGITINLYGSRAGSSSRSRDIYPEVFVTGKTNSSGNYILNDAKKYFNPNRNEFKNVPTDLPYGRWFGFLAEIISGSSKKHVWLPEYEVQMPYFEGEDTYKVNVAL